MNVEGHAGLVDEKMTLSNFAYDQQFVSDIANISDKFYLFFLYNQQEVSNIAHFVKGSLFMAFLMTNRE